MFQVKPSAELTSRMHQKASKSYNTKVHMVWLENIRIAVKNSIKQEKLNFNI